MLIFITFQQSFPSKRKSKYIGLTSWWISESAQCVLSQNFPKSIQSNLKHCALASLQCIFWYFSTLNIHKGNLNIIFNPHLEICCEMSKINQRTHFISTIKWEKLSTVFKINLYPHCQIQISWYYSDIYYLFIYCWLGNNKIWQNIFLISQKWYFTKVLPYWIPRTPDLEILDRKDIIPGH